MQTVDAVVTHDNVVAIDQVMVYRLYNPYTGEHLYTMDENEIVTLVQLGWEYEGIAFYAYDAGRSVSLMQIE